MIVINTESLRCGGIKWNLNPAVSNFFVWKVFVVIMDTTVGMSILQVNFSLRPYYICLCIVPAWERTKTLDCKREK